MNGNQNIKQLELYPEENQKSAESNRTNQADTIPQENELTLLALSSIQGIGFITIRNLFYKFRGNLGKIWELNRDELSDFFRQTRIQNANQIVEIIQNDKAGLLENAKNQVTFLRRRKTSIIFRYTKEYPKRLENLKDAPAWLFVEGNPDLLNQERIVAVVGTRSPTPLGVETARKLSVTLIKQGFIILSGLAEGIDEAGHQSAVDFGVPTIAVLGHGTEEVFPAKTARLRKELVDAGGAVISEYLYKDRYAKEKFIQRNRIQAALSGAVAVVEAKSKSGTAHTVRFAKTFGTSIFGVFNSFPESTTNELVAELEKDNYPVFDVGTKNGREILKVYLTKQFGEIEKQNWTIEPKIFNHLLSEIERVGNDHDAVKEDYDWLILKIQELKQKAEHK